MTEQNQDEIIEELGQLKTWKQDQDGKLYIMPKDEVKAVIGRSPDWRDVFLMRYYFELRSGSTKASSYKMPKARRLGADSYKNML